MAATESWDDDEFDVFLEAFNAFRAQQYRAKLEKNDAEKRARILELISGKDNTNCESDKPYEPDLIRNTLKVVNDLHEYSQL